jgi:hypothetical protein
MLALSMRGPVGRVVFLLAVWAVGTSRADERITDFRCDIVVAEDGLMTVTETIGVVSTGKKIKQGIYRDIPVRYGGGWFGLGVTVPFTIERVECDGVAAAFHTERASTGSVSRWPSCRWPAKG